MSSEKDPINVSQENFIQNADRLIARANAAETPIREVAESAQEIQNQITDIHLGKLAIDPPLSKEQIAHYTTVSTSILSLSQKTASSLEANKQTGEMTRKERRKAARRAKQQKTNTVAAAASSTFTGHASSSKT